jgi:MFS family permease
MGPVLTGLAIDHAGVAAAFALLCFPPVLGLVLVGMDKPVALPAKAAPDPQPQGGLWLDETLRPVFVVTALLTVCWDLFTFVMPVHGTHLGLSATAIGTLAGCFASGSFLVRVVLPWVARRLGERRILLAALTGATLCYAGVPLAPGFVGLMAVAFVLGAFLGSGQPMAMSLLHRSAPAHRTGEAMGLRTSIISLSQATLPLVFGVLGAWWGSGSVFWLVAVLVGGGVLYVWRRLTP